MLNVIFEIVRLNLLLVDCARHSRCFTHILQRHTIELLFPK